MTRRLASGSALAFLLLAAAPALAQPAAPPAPKTAPVAADDMAAFEKDLDALFVRGGLTADQAASRAGSASPTVRRRFAEVQAAIASAEAAELQRVPQISGKASYTRLSYIAPFQFTNPMTGMGLAIPFLQNSYDLQATLSLPLSDYLLRYPKLIDAAHLAEDVARTSRRDAEVSAGEEARLAYYEWVRAKLQVLIAQRQLLQVQATLGQVRALAEVQRLSKADLLRVESQEAEAEQALDQLGTLSRLREEQLRLLIGAPEGEPLAIGEDIRQDLSVPTLGELDQLMQQATQRRLDFRVLDTGIRAKEEQRDSERANAFPRLSAFGTVEDARPNPRIFPQTDTFRFTWMAGLQVTWTLNDALITKTTLDRLAAETDELRADRENLEHGTRIEVLAAMQAVQIAVHALQTTKKGLEASEEGYRVRKELLNAERATAVELVDAETDLTRARIAALNARVDLRVALTQLAHALGEDAGQAK